MQGDIIILLVLLTFVRVWVYELPTMVKKVPLNFKPFNCGTCLSWWLGVLFAVVLQNPIYFILYLIFDIYDRNL